MKETVALRPHHIMCLSFFEGKGYSDAFTEHMWKIWRLFRESGETETELVLHTDEICSACPENHEGVCNSPDQVLRYDRKVLECTGLSESDRISFSDFQELAREKIFKTGLREKICGGCRWNALCRAKEDGRKCR